MKTIRLFLPVSKQWLVPALCLAALRCAAADKAPVSTHTESNSIPQSAFTVPASMAEGCRDPFFPKTDLTTRGRVVPINTGTKAPPVVVELVYNGMSGTPEHRLAMINYRTFEVNELQAVPTKNGKVNVRCLEIKEESVTVEVNGERRVIPFLGK